MLQNISLVGSGVAPNNTAQNTLVAAIASPGPGRYKVWGHGRHTLADGLKISSPSSIVIPSGPNAVVNFGPYIVEITSTSVGIGVSLNTATGAADTASAIVFAERIA